ncbi:feruloyl CoA ortho-hydroxylase F6H1-3-like [Raphanus sativus]|uniref:Feruloyl CoA ortho-hydroxylase F6H1-3-like n=1 Tax=Raphanus sativus TaxID=3726 RepID=A0A9W3D026_RAPSA|nr:feruloyl CoA ortho-hydroxylase F6H1-3-like [Raphanus sativus]
MAPIGLTDVAITDFVVNQRHGVKGLVDVISPKTLPSCYIQLPEKRVTTEKLIMEAATTGRGSLSTPVIPVIDVSDWKDPSVAEEICEAAATLGFFQIVNHGVSVDEQNELRAAGRGFFDLPTEEKKRYWEGSSVSDTAWYMTSFNPSKEAKLEWRDYLKFEYLSDQVDFAATWPTVCRNEVVNHSNRMKPIGRKILEILMNNLNARVEEQTLMGTLRMNVNYYPECPDPKLTVGTGYHCDINTLTLLLQDDILGSLYARYGDKWLHIPPVMGAIVVNIGDMLQILSNDRYKSVEHLVMASRFLSRISFAYYCGPSYDSVIEPLREVLEKGEKPLYKATMYSDYMKYYFARPHTGSKTIESIKLP